QQRRSVLDISKIPKFEESINLRAAEFLRRNLPRIEYPTRAGLQSIQFLREPFHFRLVIARFTRNKNVMARMRAGEALEHPAWSAENVVPQRCVGFAQPAGEPDPTGNGVKLGNADSRFPEHQIVP